MTKPDQFGQPRRRDEFGDFHEIEPTACERCGCTMFRAVDDRAIVWEPGAGFDENCTDRSCRCHAAPRVGERVDEPMTERLPGESEISAAKEKESR